MAFFYPPTEDQLRIITPFGNIWDNDIFLGIVRIISFLLIVLSLYWWYKLVFKLINKKAAVISVLIIILSPTIFVLWMLHPFDCLKIFIVMTAIYFMSVKGIKNWILFSMIVSFLLVLFFSLSITTERSSFFHKLNINDAQKELNVRFDSEDKLTNPIKIPLLVRRLSYNKYYFFYKQIISEIIPFFDLETVFFQEVHPMEQKSVIIFIWPEIFLFLFGIFFLFKKGDKKIINFLFLVFSVAFFNYLLTPNEPYRKFEFILFPISILIALTVERGLKMGLNWFSKSLFAIAILFVFYGIFTNFYDLFKRTDHWLDNRPLFYEFVYKTISKEDINNYDLIHVSSLVGKSDLYCQFYLKKCDSNKFIFKSFDLSNDYPVRNNLYAGFVGEFIGSDFKNNMDDNWKNMINGHSMNILDTKKLRDTIAYQYGNYIVVGATR